MREAQSIATNDFWAQTDEQVDLPSSKSMKKSVAGISFNCVFILSLASVRPEQVLFQIWLGYVDNTQIYILRPVAHVPDEVL